MPDTVELHRPVLGRPGDACAECGAPLAADQRYCLSCGARRAEARVPYADLLRAPEPPGRAPAAVPVRRTPPLNSAVAGMLGAAALGLGLLAGALIVRHNDSGRIVVPAPIVNVAPPAAAAATATPAPSAAPAAFAPDWPAGQNGWTVQLQLLRKDGTTPEAVATAKAAAAGKGAAAVGALDSDAFPSLDGGQYVIYSGAVGASKQAARQTLGTLRAAFPDAKLIKLGAATTPQPAKTQTPEDAQKNIRKAPPTVKSQGKTVKPDTKAPGAGGTPTEIG